MGPSSFIFNDIDRLRPCEKYESNLRGYIKKMIDKKRLYGKDDNDLPVYRCFSSEYDSPEMYKFPNPTDPMNLRSL